MKNKLIEKLKLDKEELETEKVKRINLIKKTNEILQRDGVLIPLSGGVDSTTSLYLAIEAVGLDRVTGWFAPYTHITKSETNRYVEDIRRDTGIEIIIDNKLRDILKTAETPRFHNGLIKVARKRWESQTKMFYREGDKTFEAPMNIHTGAILGCGEKLVDIAYSGIATQHYFREAMVKTKAIRRNLTLVCCANLSECLIGWYTKGGLDDTGDVKPIADLYKTQVKALANHIPIVESVRKRKPTSDMGIGTDEEIGLPDYLIIDTTLKGYLDLGMTPKEISEETKFPIWEVVDVILKNRRTEHMRHGAFTTKDIRILESRTPNYFNCVNINKPKE